MELERVDLNLLLALDVLVRERSVTHAGKKLGLSQPAMSYTLAKLRELLGDAVLVRTPAGMVPTPRALELAGPVRRALDELGAALSKEGFDPASSKAEFTLALSDHTALVVLPRLAARLVEIAPGVQLEVRTWAGERTWREVAAGEVDLAVGVGDLSAVPAGLYKRTLLKDRFTVAVRAGHPRVGRRLTLEAYVEALHLLVSPRGGSRGLVDVALEERGLSRRVAMVVPHFLVAPFIVASSDLVLTISNYVAEPFAEYLPIELFPPPVDFDSGDWFCVWHERTHGYAAHRWLREQLSEIAGEVAIACDGRHPTRSGRSRPPRLGSAPGAEAAPEMRPTRPTRGRAVPRKRRADDSRRTRRPARSDRTSLARRRGAVRPR
jgi:DNA-binding transcriptional LysR family regulator